jgi:hypothetical protein
MDQWDEKEAEREAEGRRERRARHSREVYPIQHQNRESTTSEIIERMVDDIEKATRPPSITDGTDRERHRSAEIAADRNKRESVETNYRFSQITANTDFEDGDGDPEKAKEEESGILRPNPAVVRPPHHRAGVSMATTIGADSRRSLPSLRRKETKLAQKEAHPW